MKSEIRSRRERAQKLMGSKGFAALILSDAENLQYFSGVTEPSIQTCGSFIISQYAQPALAVMWLDKKVAQEQAEDVSIHAYTPDSHGKVITKILQSFEVEKGVVGMDYCSMKELGNLLRQSLPSVNFVDAASAIEELRAVKSEEEIRCIQEACKISDEGLKVALESLKPGITELQIASMAEQRMIALGSHKLKHRTIVASGPRVSLVHPFATDNKIAKGDLVVIDTGAVYKGYCSDITRTAVMGRASEEIEHDFNALRNAQEAVLQRLKGGVSVTEIEATARKALKAADCQLIDFIGHSIGLSVEESPFLRPTKTGHPDAKIENSMTVALFQSYIQSKRSLGIRLEDTVAVTESGAKMLTKYPRELFAQCGF